MYPHNVVANSIVWLSAHIPVSKPVDPRDSVLLYATKMRESLGRLKNPEFVKDMAADVAKILSQVAWDKKCQDVSMPREGCLIVNNTWK